MFRLRSSDIFTRLEREANDEFRLLDEFGPAYFDAEHLVELHAKARERLAFFLRRQQLATTSGAIGTGWVFLAILANALDFMWVAFAAGALASISFAIFAMTIVWQKKRFESKGELEYSLRVIEEELRRRGRKRREAKR